MVTSPAQVERGDGGWAIPSTLTAALGACLLAFAPFAGDSIEDDRFWLAAFGVAWLALSGVLVFREGPAVRSVPKAIAYHTATVLAFIPHLLVGALLLSLVSRVAGALSEGMPLFDAPIGLLIVGGLFAAWLALTAWALHSWLRRSWATLVTPVLSVGGLALTVAILVATFGLGQH